MAKKSPLHVYHIDGGIQYWYIAKSARAALNMFVKDTTYPLLTVPQYKNQYPETTITQCDESRPFTLVDLAEWTGEKEDEERTMTLGEWAKEAGEGCLATSEC